MHSTKKCSLCKRHNMDIWMLRVCCGWIQGRTVSADLANATR